MESVVPRASLAYSVVLAEFAPRKTTKTAVYLWAYVASVRHGDHAETNREGSTHAAVAAKTSCLFACVNTDIHRQKKSVKLNRTTTFNPLLS